MVEYTGYTLSYTPYVISRYLYGFQEGGIDGVPTNLFHNNLIRDTNEYAPVFNLDVNEFMTSGAGRFATGYQNPIVKAFMQSSAFTSADAGTYTKSEIIAKLGLDPESNLALVFYADDYSNNYNDYIERILIFQTQSFQINDEARFHIDQNGEPSITDFAIIPDKREGSAENFDFQGGSSFGNALQPYIEPKVDPFDIGRKWSLILPVALF